MAYENDNLDMLIIGVIDEADQREERALPQYEEERSVQASFWEFVEDGDTPSFFSSH